MAEGVTTMEVKSGYGLDRDSELKSLRAARRLGEVRPLSVSTTFLGAHAIPPEAKGDGDGYIATVCEDMLPAVAAARLADSVDAFCETIGFTPDQVARVFEAARAHGLPVKLHAEQLSNQKGAELAARFGAQSADHLEHVDEEGIAALARSGTVAVLLPGAFYFVRKTHKPPVDALRRAGAHIALASDSNPGTSPLTSLLLAMNMGATLFRLTVEECLLGITREAARALGRLETVGTLETGKSCDLAIWDIERPPSSSTASASIRCISGSGGATEPPSLPPRNRGRDMSLTKIAASDRFRGARPLRSWRGRARCRRVTTRGAKR
jgi:imidazolonepropionase